ncbi:hypothetical protein EC844_1107 [Acinetobacter calcoaceticus]|uniref:Uncharacterized protein n=1 Tax=Acinetobacter calcoaceticus TaxID=471 RepID=A0A4R1XSX1_ACICA|nr:hypothetical protein EC844_1107 [Acinetobacter calcoaceticus]
MTFQLIQVKNHQANVTCPYCQTDVIDWSEEQYLQPCDHTLFVAMDLSFEYVSDRFEETLPRSIDEIHAHDDQLNIYQEISQSSFAEFKLYKMDLGALGLSRYIGFGE